ncbi:MAG TPA: hypothetical protein VFW94_24060 [Candidatus Acidoferrales bacterium]|nr:hypothetical protein [Candidatus Acidoferrales bacterium]
MDETKKNGADPEVRKAIDEARANRSLSHLNASYVSQVYNGHRPPSDELLDHLELERRVTITYVKKQRRWK